MGGFGGTRKSKQEFSITISGSGTSGTATITAVDTDNYDLTLNGWTIVNSSDDGKPVSIVLTNSTTVTANVGQAANGDYTVKGEIVDHYGSVT